MADNVKKRNLGKRLLHIWQQYFAKTLQDVKPTNLIEYSIDFKSNACPLYSKILYYTKYEQPSYDCIFSKLEEADIFV